MYRSCRGEAECGGGLDWCERCGRSLVLVDVDGPPVAAGPGVVEMTVAMEVEDEGDEEESPPKWPKTGPTASPSPGGIALRSGCTAAEEKLGTQPPPSTQRQRSF